MNSNESTITVKTKGNAETTPHQALIEIIIQREEPDAEDAEKSATDSLETLKTSLDQHDLRIISHRLTRPGEATVADLEGYRVKYHVEVDCTLGEIKSTVLTATGLGCIVNQVQYTSTEKQRTKLREEAVKDGLEQTEQDAETIAKHQGKEIIELEDITADSFNIGSTLLDSALDYTEGVDLQPPPITATIAVTSVYSVE